MEWLESINILGFIDARQFFILLHLLGVGIGMGSALSSDWMFMKSVRDEVISHKEFEFLKTASMFVWIGLGLLILSGVFLVILSPGFLESSKFLAKMTVVGVIIVNGIIFHTSHIPRMLRHRGEHFPSSDEFRRKSRFLYISGAVSASSWIYTLVLGGLGSVPYSYVSIVGLYLVVLAIAVASALYMRNKHFNSK